MFARNLSFLPGELTLAGKVTNYLITYISLNIAEQSEAKSAKRSFASKSLELLLFDSRF
jgi:hypothetical protein